jgi:hypothetical protein
MGWWVGGQLDGGMDGHRSDGGRDGRRGEREEWMDGVSLDDERAEEFVSEVLLNGADQRTNQHMNGRTNLICQI